MSKLSLSQLSYFVALVSSAASNTAAQDTPLGQAVQGAPNDTALQVSTGDAINRTCLGLVGRAQGQGTRLSAAEQSLLGNCSDMVGTALGILDLPGIGTSLGFSSSQLAEAMQQVSGEESASAGRLATESSNSQYATLGMRMDAIRAGARATSGGISVAMGGEPVYGGNAGDNGMGWGWYLNGAIGSGSRDASAREDAYDFDSFGGTLGADYQFASGLVAGVAVGYYDYEIDFDDVASFETGSTLVNTQAGGGFETDGFALSAYVIGNLGRFYIDGLMSYGISDIESERIVKYTGSSNGEGSGQSFVLDRSMLGDTDSESLTLGVSTGTVFRLDLLDIGVDLGLSYLDASVDGYTEDDIARGMDTAQFSGLNLAYDDQDFDSLQSRLGLQLSKTFSYSGGVAVPYFNATWRREFKNDASVIRARLAVQQEGEVFQINAATDDPDNSFFELAVGITAVFANNLQGFAEYRTVEGLDRVDAGLLSIGIRGAF